MSKNIKLPELLLIVLSAKLTLLLAIGILTWLAPGLLGLPSDMILVHSSKVVAPFYEGVFRRQDLESKEFMLKDPITTIRAKPFYKDLGYIYHMIY